MLIQTFYRVEYLFNVPPQSFNPPPKVMSGVIKLQLKNAQYQMKNNSLFVQLVKTAFNQRHKMFELVC